MDGTEPCMCWDFLHIPTFSLKEALDGFSLADSSCQHHSSCALGPLSSEIRVIERKLGDAVTSDLITKRAAARLTTKGSGGLRPQHSVEMPDEGMSHVPGGTEQGRGRCHHTIQKRVSFQTHALSRSGTCRLMFSDWG